MASGANDNDVTLNFNNDGVDMLMESLRDVIEMLQEINQSLQAVNDSLSKMGRSSSGGARSAAQATQQATQGMQNMAKQAKAARGPLADLQKAYQDYLDAVSSGDPARIQDARYHWARKSQAYKQSQQYMQSMNPGDPNIIQRLLQGLAISAKGTPIGWSVAKLAGAGAGLAGALGGGHGGGGGGGGFGGVGAGGGFIGAAGPQGQMLAIVAEAAKLIMEVIKILVQAFLAAVKYINDFTQTMRSTGTDARTAARGIRLGAGLGGDFSQIAHALQADWDKGGIAASYARRNGINPRGDIFVGDMDIGAKAMKQLEHFFKVNDAEALRMTKMHPILEQFLWARDASPDMQKQLLAGQGEAMSPEARRQAADAQIALNLAMHDFQLVLARLAANILPFVTSELKKFMYLIEWIGELVQFAANPVGKALDWLNGDDPGKVKEDAARDRHTEAMNKHTDALNGIYGPGMKRAGDAIKPWMWQQFEEASYGQAAAVGAFVL